MKENFISFEVAKLANEKGMPVFEYIGWKTKFYHPITQTMFAYGRTGRIPIITMYYAPTQSLLQRWLREKHNIKISISFHENMSSGIELWDWAIKGKKVVYRQYKTYEGALEAGLLEGLKRIT